MFVSLVNRTVFNGGNLNIILKSHKKIKQKGVFGNIKILRRYF